MQKGGVESPLRKMQTSLLIKHISKTLEYLVYLLLTNLAALRAAPTQPLYFWYGSQTVAPHTVKSESNKS